MPLLKQRQQKGRSKQCSFCFESNDAAGVVTFSWVQSSESMWGKKGTDSEWVMWQGCQILNAMWIWLKENFWCDIFCSVWLETGITDTIIIAL